MCEIQLRTCCGCTLRNPGRSGRERQPGGDSAGSSKHKSQWPGPLPGAGHVPSHGPPTLRERPAVTHHHTHSSLDSLRLSLSLSALRSVGKGMQQTLLDTSVYNSCPAPKIEQSSSTHCFAAKIEACALSKGCMLADKGGDYLSTLEMTASTRRRLIKPGGSGWSSRWTASKWN